ncbi:MAG: hypothetical protein M3256_09845 [Actinomycetota bacterium]|nr:hypothetical protein [Actinomycetota bacterium]
MFGPRFAGVGRFAGTNDPSALANGALRATYAAALSTRARWGRRDGVHQLAEQLARLVGGLGVRERRSSGADLASPTLAT